MGEMADDAYDRALDELFGDNYEEEYSYGYGHTPGYDRTHAITCDRCGAENLKWRLNDAGDWRLYENERIEGNRKKQHECNPASADDFEDLS